MNSNRAILEKAYRCTNMIKRSGGRVTPYQDYMPNALEQARAMLLTQHKRRDVLLNLRSVFTEHTLYQCGKTDYPALCNTALMDVVVESLQKYQEYVSMNSVEST